MRKTKKLSKGQKLEIKKAEECEEEEDKMMRRALFNTFQKFYGPIKIRSGPPRKL